MALLLAPSIELGTSLARSLYAAAIGPIDTLGEAERVWLRCVGAAAGATADCLLGILAARCVRTWQQGRRWKSGSIEAPSVQRPHCIGPGLRVRPRFAFVRLPARLRPRFAIARLSARRAARTWAERIEEVQTDAETRGSQPWRMPAAVAAACLAIALAVIVVQTFTAGRMHRLSARTTDAGGLRGPGDFEPVETHIPAIGQPVFVDIGPKANQRLSSDMHGNPGNNLASLPIGTLKAGLSAFNIGGGVIHLHGANAADLPAKVQGIRVDRPVWRLHVLHAAGYGGGSTAASLYRVEVARYVVHFADGVTIPIAAHYGEDLCDWWDWAEPPARPGGWNRREATVAWTGASPAAERGGHRIRLFVSVWRNPMPGKRVESIDFESANTMCDPFLVAMTIER